MSDNAINIPRITLALAQIKEVQGVNPELKPFYKKRRKSRNSKPNTGLPLTPATSTLVDPKVLLQAQEMGIIAGTNDQQKGDK